DEALSWSQGDARGSAWPQDYRDDEGLTHNSRGARSLRPASLLQSRAGNGRLSLQARARRDSAIHAGGRGEARGLPVHWRLGGGYASRTPRWREDLRCTLRLRRARRYGALVAGLLDQISGRTAYSLPRPILKTCPSGWRTCISRTPHGMSVGGHVTSMPCSRQWRWTLSASSTQIDIQTPLSPSS